MLKLIKNKESDEIPQDWQMYKLDELGRFQKGKNIPKSSIIEYGVPCVLYGEIYTKYNFYSAKLFSNTSLEVAKTSTEINSGDILFAGSGEKDEDIGKCFTYTGLENAYAGGDGIIFSPYKNDPLYLGFLLNSPTVIKQKSFMGQGSSVFHIYPSNLKQILVPLPPTKAEQTAIAKALKDADVLIQKLEQLISKKRSIKTGAMRELLRPKEGWKVNQIKNLASICTGTKNTQDKVDNGNFPFFVRSQTIERINSYSFNGGAILVAGDGVGTGKVMHYFHGKFDFHQRVYKLSDFASRINSFYFFLYFKNNFLERIKQMTAKSSVDSIRMEMIANMEIHYPSIEEQFRIAETLADIEHEISKLESCVEKWKMLKQGMIQSLLTGKIRLI